MRSYNEYRKSDSESSESDISDRQEIVKPAPVRGKIVKVSNQEPRYELSSDSEGSSNSEEESNHSEDERYKRETSKNMGRPAFPRKQQQSSDSEEEDEESSIDQIEERIHRLEIDLEKRIDKHRKSSDLKERPSENSSNEKPKPKNVGSPPLPKRLETKAPTIPAQSAPRPAPQPKYTHQGSENNNKLNIQVHQPVQKRQEIKPIYHPPPAPPAEQSKQVKEREKEVKEYKESPKKKTKDNEESKIKVVAQVEKKRTLSKNVVKKDGELRVQHAQALEKIDKLEQTVEKLKLENRELKKQLAGSRKKPLEELDKLKEITDNKDNKLEKEIELLKVIESLQAKLKKSIQKKLPKNRIGSVSASLLHKGLPSSLLT